MKPRARRVTLAAAAFGVAALVILATIHWGTVRNHVEAWRFQLTRQTETIEPGPSHSDDNPMTLPFSLLASLSGHPVIFKKPGVMMGWSQWLKTEPALSDAAASAVDTLRLLQRKGFRVLEQHFPRRAYVVIRNQDATP